MIIIVFGLPGSGKSYFASRLAYKLKAHYLNSDLIRKELIDDLTYTQKEKWFVYYELLARAKTQLKHNNIVVLDATFYKNEIRQHFIKNIKNKTKLLFIETIADEGLIEKRTSIVRHDSDADFTVYQKIKTEWEPMTEPHLILQSGNYNINQMLETAMEFLKIKDDA